MGGGGGGDDLKLLGTCASPHTLRVRLALRLKGVSYDYVEQDPKKKNTAGELLLPRKLPVVLIHGGKPVRESFNILQYLDDVFAGVGPNLLPADIYERAVARYWADFVDETVYIVLLAVIELYKISINPTCIIFDRQFLLCSLTMGLSRVCRSTAYGGYVQGGMGRNGG
jgi:glutathione S-transferase